MKRSTGRENISISASRRSLEIKTLTCRHSLAWLALLARSLGGLVLLYPSFSLHKPLIIID